jgi:UDP-N-acetylmuramate--alanine ligase
MAKIRVGILFGGSSREREISFAGGRTVFDNLDKSLFEPIPLFLDSLGQLIRLDWQYLYKGTIRDFYPPVKFLPHSRFGFQVYAESIATEIKSASEMANTVGSTISWIDLKSTLDFVFLCLHGPDGEDGRIQGILEFYRIPYSGSGIFGSAAGIHKGRQKQLMSDMGFDTPPFVIISRTEWVDKPHSELFEKIILKVSFPLVVKSARQGSSIGVTVLKNNDPSEFSNAVDHALFIRKINTSDFHHKNRDQQLELVRHLCDIREGLGLPILILHKGQSERILHPDGLFNILSQSSTDEIITLQAEDAETEVVIEGFIDGREFSCIVVDNELPNGNTVPLALPPTEIRKGGQMFDYRSKYLPGLARKVTPIDLPQSEIERIAKEAEKLYAALGFEVYARIDGFYGKNGQIYLNDPNTTSGMMPSSFFFHQAAEIGLNPSKFLTFIIRASLAARVRSLNAQLNVLLKRLDHLIDLQSQNKTQKIKVSVILGGYSSERHISVESGRNIYEKLSSSEKYQPIPVFLTGDAHNFRLFNIPVNILLKDNADDIRDKVLNFHEHPALASIRLQATNITSNYAGLTALSKPEEWSFDILKREVDAVFIALHGRPGEDGAIQKKLEEVGLPYNGSGVQSSSITINKFITNEMLKAAGLSVPAHLLVSQMDWQNRPHEILSEVASLLKYPLIAKPVDDGCSSAVRKIKNEEELNAFASLILRDKPEPNSALLKLLKVKENEEFPQKKEFLLEELIRPEGAKHFLEVTGGLLTRFNKQGTLEYEVFEASEALAGGEVLSLEEKFLAGEGQNITPARYSGDETARAYISAQVKDQLERAARALHVEGYARIDAFVRVYKDNRAEVVFIEVNSLPGMTPATCIFHQTAIQGYKPLDFIDHILTFAEQRNRHK